MQLYSEPYVKKNQRIEELLINKNIILSRIKCFFLIQNLPKSYFVASESDQIKKKDAKKGCEFCILPIGDMADTIVHNAIYFTDQQLLTPTGGGQNSINTCKQKA